MHLVSRVLVVAAIAGSQAIALAQESRTESRFQIDYAASGITSLRHVGLQAERSTSGGFTTTRTLFCCTTPCIRSRNSTRR
jgi:hypothetical protein